jgi:hypothetical protein
MSEHTLGSAVLAQAAECGRQVGVALQLSRGWGLAIRCHQRLGLTAMNTNMMQQMSPAHHDSASCVASHPTNAGDFAAYFQHQWCHSRRSRLRG